MKIWNVIANNESGIWVDAFASEADARARFADLVQIAWDEEMPGRDWPGDAEAAYSTLCATPGFYNTLAVQACDLVPGLPSPPPAPVLPARRTFSLQIAVSVRAYGSVEVEARSLAEAMEILRAEAAGAPGAAWDNAGDVEWSSACEHTIISATDDDTGDSLDGLDLTRPDDPLAIITADELAAHIRAAQG